MTARRQPSPIAVQTVGKPMALSLLARLLLDRKQRPRLEVVTDEQQSRSVPAQLEGPQRRFD